MYALLSLLGSSRVGASTFGYNYTASPGCSGPTTLSGRSGTEYGSQHASRSLRAAYAASCCAALPSPWYCLTRAHPPWWSKSQVLIAGGATTLNARGQSSLPLTLRTHPRLLRAGMSFTSRHLHARARTFLTQVIRGKYRRGPPATARTSSTSTRSSTNSRASCSVLPRSTPLEVLNTMARFSWCTRRVPVPS